MCIEILCWFLQLYFTAAEKQKMKQPRISSYRRLIQKDPLRLQRITSIEMHNATGTKYVVIVNIQNAKVVVRSESWYGYKIRRHLKLNRCARHVKKNRTTKVKSYIYADQECTIHSIIKVERCDYISRHKDSRVVGCWMTVYVQRGVSKKITYV